MEMTPQRWEATRAYIRDVFGAEDDALARIEPRARAAGLPDIAISPEVGRLLWILARSTNGGAGPRRALELGTLAGYSGVWIARALAPGGSLVTIEADPAHAVVAAETFRDAGLKDRVQVRTAAALDELPRVAGEWGDESTDFVFIDAIKTEYPDYLRLVRPLVRPGGLLIADNALGSSWWIDAPPGSDVSRDAVDRFNREVAADAGFDASCVPLRQGLLIARRKTAGDARRP